MPTSDRGDGAEERDDIDPDGAVDNEVSWAAFVAWAGPALERLRPQQGGDEE